MNAIINSDYYDNIIDIDTEKPMRNERQWNVIIWHYVLWY